MDQVWTTPQTSTNAAAGRTLGRDEPVRLTRRELEVLQLLAEGQTDREIAALLSLSARTVSSHVAHILAELGVDRRTAAAVWAVRYGLI